MLEVFTKKTRATPKTVIDACTRRLQIVNIVLHPFRHCRKVRKPVAADVVESEEQMHLDPLKQRPRRFKERRIRKTVKSKAAVDLPNDIGVGACLPLEILTPRGAR